MKHFWWGEKKTRKSGTIAGTNAILLKDHTERAKAFILKFTLSFCQRHFLNWED